MSNNTRDGFIIRVERRLTEAQVYQEYSTIHKHILAEFIPLVKDCDGMCLESLLDRIIRSSYRRKLSPPAAAKLRKDGPSPPDTLRIGGKDYGPFTPGEMRLLRVLWGKRSVDVRRVLKAVYGDDDATTTRRCPEQALDKIVKRLRERLVKYGAPVDVHKKDPYYMLEVF